MTLISVDGPEKSDDCRYTLRIPENHLKCNKKFRCGENVGKEQTKSPSQTSERAI